MWLYTHTLIHVCVYIYICNVYYSIFGIGTLVALSNIQAMAREIGAWDYMECSALSGAGVDDIIDGAMWAFVMDAQTERGKARTEAPNLGEAFSSLLWRVTVVACCN